MVCKSSIKILLLSILLAITPLIASAQGSIQISHQTYAPESLPEPGTPLALSVTLSNTRALGYNLRTYMEIDGKHIPIATAKPQLDALDRPSYKVFAYSPLAGMSYMFAAEAPDGSIAASRSFSVQRACVPPVSIVSPKMDESPEAKANIENKIVRVKKLEAELKQYERALILGDELRHTIYELGSK